MPGDDADRGDSFDDLLREAAAVPSRPVRAPGTVLGGRYRLDRLLGEGGMGIVWAATHAVTRQRVALKLMRGSESSRDTSRKRFLREARAAAGVDHPNVVPIRDVFELDDGELVMVMDLLEGETLRAKLDREGPLSLEETADRMLPVISAVAAAHAQGVIHRDLKPENLLITGAAGDTQVLDFGLAKLLPEGFVTMSASRITETGEPLGTPRYMAPEQALGEPDVDQRVDVWSVAAIVYECLAGKPFVDEQSFARVVERLSGPVPPPSSTAPELPQEILSVLDRMLTVDRGARLGDLRPLHDCLAPHATRPAPPFLPEEPLGPRTESGGRAWLYGAVALSGIVAAAAWFVGAGAERTAKPETPPLATKAPRPRLDEDRGPASRAPPPASGSGLAPVAGERQKLEHPAPLPPTSGATAPTVRSAPSRQPSAPDRKQKAPRKPGLIEDVPF